METSCHSEVCSVVVLVDGRVHSTDAAPADMPPSIGQSLIATRPENGGDSRPERIYTVCQAIP